MIFGGTALKTDEGHRALLEKWRERELKLCRRADMCPDPNGIYARSLAGQAERIAECADELEAILAEEAAALLTAPPEDAALRERLERINCKAKNAQLDARLAGMDDPDLIDDLAFASEQALALLTAPGGVPPSLPNRENWITVLRQMEARERQIADSYAETAPETAVAHYAVAASLKAGADALQFWTPVGKGSHDAECESELTSHGYTPCRCDERTAAGGVPPWGTWQPISSAPKDGTLFIGENAKGEVYKVRWCQRYTPAAWATKEGYFMCPARWIPMPLFPALPGPSSPVGSTEDEQDTAGLPGTTGRDDAKA